MHHSGLACASSADYSIEEGGAIQPCSLAVAHVACIFDFNARDDVCGNLERVKWAFIAAPDGDAIAVKQRQAQAFEPGAAHLDPGVPATRYPGILERVTVATKDSGQLVNLCLHASRRVPGHVLPLDRDTNGRRRVSEVVAVRAADARGFQVTPLSSTPEGIAS